MPLTATDARTFRLSLPFVLGFAAAANSAIVGLMAGVAWLTDRSIPPVYLATLWLMPFAYWTTLALKFRLAVKAATLGWINRSGVQCALCWGDIVAAKVISQCGFPVLVVESEADKLEYHISFCITDVEGFREAACDAAGSDHPVAVALRPA